MVNEDPLDKLLLQLEEQLLSPAVRNNPFEVAKLLHAEFVELGSSGAISSKQEIIQYLGRERPVARKIENFQAAELSLGIVLVTYRVVRLTQPPICTNRSSIWVRVGDSWQMRFHQGTLTDCES